jgi:hypothetical protein
MLTAEQKQHLQELSYDLRAIISNACTLHEGGTLLSGADPKQALGQCLERAEKLANELHLLVVTLNLPS